MPEKSAAHNHVCNRFQEAFGPPSSTLGRDDHWSIRPTRPHAPAINVLINGTDESPAVWVFDPHVHGDGVMRTSITDQATLEDVIFQIQERVKHANLPRGED